MKIRFLLAVSFTIAALGTARADSVFIKGREKALIGTVTTEDAKGIQVSTTTKGVKKDESFPAADVLDVFYDDVKKVDLVLAGGAYKLAKDTEKESNESADSAKRKAALGLAIARYSETITKMEPHKFAKRHFEYKVAILTLKQAVSEQLATDKAVVKLQAFKTSHGNCWQIVHVMPLIAQTQLDANDFKGAAATFEEMAAMDALPADVRASAELEAVRVMVRGGDLDKAQKRLDVLSAKAASNPLFASRVKMTRAEVMVGQKNMKDAVPLLQQVIKDSNDRTIKAIAHNTLGECYFKENRHNEALWEFLWVDAVFNHDKSQHAKALYYLWRTFEQLNNAERAQECREMLLNDKQFTGTEFQARGAKEAK